ncbi:MAG: hypothetical protein Q4B67_01800 [Eubacteriales bacterium]|nr:hypothetical protein [Eubacteriales bacterium]
MGIPEMQNLWKKLQKGHRDGENSKKDEELYLKWGNALKKLTNDPYYPGLHTHEIEPLSKRYGVKVWESYLENKTSKARRMFWVYGPNNNEITIIGLEPHPEDKKNGAYNRIKLSDLPN